MSLLYIILGLLQQQQRTGYDLKTECFDQCIAHLWPADQSQIYRTLDKLEAQGWITCTIEIQHDRPNRKVYQVTTAGEAELIRWLQSHQPLPILREPLLVQLYLASQLPDDQLPDQAIVHLLQQELAARRDKLAKCEAIDLPEDQITTRNLKLHRRVQELLMRREQTQIDWLKETIEVLQDQIPKE